MSGFVSNTAGPGNGLFPGQLIIRATNRAGATLTKGDHAMLDLAASATEADVYTPGSSDTDGDNSAYNTFVDPAAADVNGPSILTGVFGMCLADVADNASGLFLVIGRTAVEVCPANVDSACVAGALLIAAADNQLDLATGGSGCKIIAIAEEADTSNLANVWFNGLHGFGQDGDNSL